MNKYLRKGFIQVFVGISLCFIAPVIVSQAFNNQDHPFFLFVLIIFLLSKGMWFESLIPLLLSLGIVSWNFPLYKKYFSPKDDKKREEKN